MAERLTNIIRGPFQSRSDLKERLPRDPEEERWRMEGLEPSVQVFEGSREQKLAPNYSDYLAMREDEDNRAISRRTGPPDILDIPPSANPEV